jgi:hypothetical protein
MTRNPHGNVSDSHPNFTDPSGLGTGGECIAVGVTVPGFHFGVNKHQIAAT